MHGSLTRSRARRVDPRRVAATTSRTLAVAATAHMDRVPDTVDDYWSDLRRGRRWVWGGLLRFIDRCAAIGTPLDVVLEAIEAVRWYALEVYGPPTAPPTAALGAPSPARLLGLVA